MTVWISCRFHGEHGPERHKKFHEYLENISSQFWHKTTSFYIIETQTDRATIADYVESLTYEWLGDTVVIGSNELLGVTVVGDPMDKTDNSNITTWLPNVTHIP